MTRYSAHVHDPVLTRLFRAKMSDEQIAAEMNMDAQIVTRHRRRLGLGMPPPPKSAPVPRDLPSPTSPIFMAHESLGNRLQERPAGFFLDGRHVSTAAVVKEANRVRLKMGLEQFGPEAWRV
ncbi:hypothetical protein OJF2_51170 [Aquisphaera giovannonii]|uniref:Uncharacterized protein n=1 Tax=Aquisphaera giovannonii TaxID=406548 RepID=A0A5B9W7K3_9BACT|nr:hypothetical protein [Aquisphaera giovannonii]QEH36533.1 hypothetical protein OJF2_51170 [Aquisphaera giovannonii]